jgi:hypothetical protein
MIVGWRAGAGENDAALDVEGKPAPGVGTAHCFPGIGGPGFVTELARMRDGVEDPLAFAGADIVGADVSRSTRVGTFAHDRAHDEEVFVNDTGRVRGDGEIIDVAIESFAQVDLSIHAETRDGFSGADVDSI